MQQGVPDDVAAVWRCVREELEASLPPSTFKLWVEPLRPISAHGCTLYLAAPQRVRTWVQRRYASGLAATLRRHSPSLSEVGFVGSDSTVASQAAGDASVESPHAFENFVIGRGNRFAHAAALAVAEMPGEAYNPLFLHGAPGLGKTHLLGAVADYIRRRHPGLEVRYTTAEQFTSEFVGALRASGAERFKQRYRQLDALLIDDVQFLEDKRQTEEEFFHTFNTLYEAGSQVVLSSDRPPQALSRLAERLRDRFEWGLCAELQPPDPATSLAVLKRLASGYSSELPQSSVLQEIAKLAPENLRRLEGALTRVLAFSSLMGLPPTPALVRDVLAAKPTLGDPARAQTPSIDLEAVKEAVCVVLHLSADELLSTRRTPAIVRGRQLAIYIARTRLSLSLNQLAQFFHRDRATILYSLRAVERELNPNSSTSNALAQVFHHLNTTAKPF